MCSSSQCSLEIYAVLKEADLVWQDIFFPLWALWYLKVFSVWHLLLLLYDFSLFSSSVCMLSLSSELNGSNWKVRSEGRTIYCAFYQMTGKNQLGGGGGFFFFFLIAVQLIAVHLIYVSHLLDKCNLTFRHWLLNVYQRQLFITLLLIFLTIQKICRIKCLVREALSDLGLFFFFCQMGSIQSVWATKKKSILVTKVLIFAHRLWIRY